VYREGNSIACWLLGVSMGLLWFEDFFYGMGAPLWVVGKYRWLAHFHDARHPCGLFWAHVRRMKGAKSPGLVYKLDGGAVLLVAIAIISAGNAAERATRTGG